MLSYLSGLILKLLGWTITANLPDLQKYVVIAAPHTSNWDFLLGILFGKAIKLEPHWMGKHTLFRWPYGWFFRYMGGIPVHRQRGGQNTMQQMADRFERADRLVLALAPEGTRSKTDHWKTGFHSIARAANVPIMMGHLDFGKKEVGIGGMFHASDDIEADFEIIRAYYKDKRGKNPENASLIQVRKKAA